MLARVERTRKLRSFQCRQGGRDGSVIDRSRMWRTGRGWRTYMIAQMSALRTEA